MYIKKYNILVVTFCAKNIKTYFKRFAEVVSLLMPETSFVQRVSLTFYLHLLLLAPPPPQPLVLVIGVMDTYLMLARCVGHGLVTGFI